MARKQKTTPAYEVGRPVWVKAKVTRIAPHHNLEDTTLVTIEVEGGHLQTLWVREGDDRIVVRDE